MPKNLVGTWSARQVVTVRYQTGFMSYRFVKDTVQTTMNIQEDGRVKGTMGGARFEECVLSQNRGWFGRTFNLFTDYIITGTLSGSIFEEDTLTAKEISAPSNLKDDTITGSIFQKQGSDAFPMVNIRLARH